MFGQGNYNYYAVVGWNGVAVMDNWAGVLYIKKYIKKATTMGFDVFEDAENWALMQFANYLPLEYDNLTYLKLNHAVFRKHLRPEPI